MPRAAARVTDAHTCPAQDVVTPGKKRKILADVPPVMKPHVGGPVLGEGSPDVNINGLKAARCGDLGKCEGAPATDVIVTGAARVFINKRLAAVVGSITMHKGAVVAGSGDVFMGDAMAGASLGDADAGTAACLEAAKKRDKFIQSGGRDQSQGKDMNCGHESTRQLCIQKCQQEKLPKTSPACAACDKTEDEWYRQYLSKEKDKHNTNNKDEIERITRLNDERWKKVQEAPCATTKEQEGTRGDLTRDREINKSSWQPYQGRSVDLHASSKVASAIVERVPIERLPSFIGDDQDKDAKEGKVGSFPDTRKDMLEWCGIKSEPGTNTPEAIAGDLANGKPIIVPVDVGKLNGRGPEGSHVVSVTQMTFNDKGELVEVVMNDTAGEPPTQCCGRKFSGPGVQTFKDALLPGNPTNVPK